LFRHAVLGGMRLRSRLATVGLLEELLRVVS
jgi:hypothetical protein